MPVVTEVAGPVDVVVVLEAVLVLLDLVEDAGEMSFAPQTPFWTGAPTLDLR